VVGFGCSPRDGGVMHSVNSWACAVAVDGERSEQEDDPAHFRALQWVEDQLGAFTAKRELKSRSHPGPARYGWARVRSTYVPVEHEQAVIARMLAMRQQGLGYLEIAERLNREGVPARRGRWHASSVWRVATREASGEPNDGTSR